MPVYTIRNVATDEVVEHFISYAELEEMLKDPNLRQEFCPIHIGDPISLGAKKPDSTFQKYVLGRIRDGQPKKYRDSFDRRFRIPREV